MLEAWQQSQQVSEKQQCPGFIFYVYLTWVVVFEKNLAYVHIYDMFKYLW